MTERSDHRFSATLSIPDLAVIGCLQALAKFSQETGNNIIPCEGTEEKDWRARWPEGDLPFFNRSISRSFQK
jgi:hypothetical protein